MEASSCLRLLLGKLRRTEMKVPGVLNTFTVINRTIEHAIVSPIGRWLHASVPQFSLRNRLAVRSTVGALLLQKQRMSQCRRAEEELVHVASLARCRPGPSRAIPSIASFSYRESIRHPCKHRRNVLHSSLRIRLADRFKACESGCGIWRLLHVHGTHRINKLYPQKVNQILLRTLV